MVGDAMQNQIDTELLAWVDSIPFSKPAKNLTKDFSDAGNFDFNIHSILLGLFVFHVLFYPRIELRICHSSRSGDLEIVLSTICRASQLRASE